MSTSVSWPVIGGTSFSVPATGEVNWQALSNYLIALAGAQSVTSQKIAIRVATATPITVTSASDCVVISDLAVAGAVAVNLPAGVTGQYFAIIDGKGDAATNNVTITGNGGQTINGAATYVINKNNGGVVLAFVSGNWTVFAEFSSFLAAQAANTVIANATGSTAIPTAVPMVSAATASAVMIRNASANVYANSFIENFTTTATAAGTTTLTVASSPILNFTGTTTQTVVMPVTSTLTTGHKFFITNRSTGIVTVNSSGSNLIQAMAPNTTLMLTCILTSGTTAASWDAVYGSTTGSISGSGLKNYIPAPNDNNAALWVASGGGIAVTTETTASNFPDNITQTTAIKILRASGSDYAYTRFTVDQADYQVLCGILFAMKYAGTAGDYTLALYTNTASNYGGSYVQVTLPTSSIPAASTGMNFQTNGIAGGSGTQYMELRINGIAGTTPLYLNNVTFTPNPPEQGAAISEWQSITFAAPSNLGAGSMTNTAYFRRVGSNMELKMRSIKDATPGSGASTVTWAMPSGYTINTSVTPNSLIGMAAFTGSTYGPYVDVKASGTAAFVVVENGAATNLTGADFTASSEVNFQLTIPIAEWAGNGVVNLGAGAQEEYLSSTNGTWDAAAAAGNTVYGPAGSPISGSLTANRNKVCRLQYPLQTTDRLQLQFQYPSSGGWVDAEQSAYPWLNWPTVPFGGYIAAATVGSTDVTVFFSQYAIAGTTYNSATGASNYSAATHSAWRLVRYKSSSPVGFGLAGTDGSSGLVAPYSTSGIIASGQYTPTATAGTNVSTATTQLCLYSRVGKVVTVSGRIDITTTTGTSTPSDFYITLPIASSLTASTDLLGSGARECGSGTPYMAVTISADTAGDRAYFTFNSTVNAANAVRFTFQYQIL